MLISLLLFQNIESLHNELKQKHTHQLEYKVSKNLIFGIVDNKHGTVCSAYTPSECKSYPSIDKVFGNHSETGFKLNTEHTWPQSKGAKSFPAQGDLHHLFATSKESNSMRKNYPFCEVFESFWEKDGSQQGYDEDFNDCFEPVDSHKGNVARAMFYFAVRYQKALSSLQVKLFKKWSRIDPVDNDEHIRNNKIESLQGNRNPFIDNENLIHDLF